MRPLRLPIAIALAFLGSCGGGGGGGGPPPAPVGDGTFRAAVPAVAVVGDGAIDLATADFNGDGKADLVVVNEGSNGTPAGGPRNLSILLGVGDGSFVPATPATVTAGPLPWAVLAADFDNDGKADLVVRNWESAVPAGESGLSLLRGNGDGTFAPPAVLPGLTGVATGQTKCMASGDFNADGKRDIAYAFLTVNLDLTYSISLRILRGNGNGTFTPGTPAEVWPGGSSSAFSPWLWAIAVGNYDGVGGPDVAVTLAATGCDGPNEVRIALNDGDGGLALHPTPVTVLGPFHLTAGAFTPGSFADLAVVNACDDAVRILLGSGGGTFSNALPATLGTGSFTYELTSGDFNGDGLADLAVLSASVLVFLGNGAGQFAPSPQGAFGTPSGTGTLLAADFNGDGILDLATADWDGNFPAADTVSIYLGNAR